MTPPPEKKPGGGIPDPLPPRFDPEAMARRIKGTPDGDRHGKAAAAFHRGDLIHAAKHWERLAARPGSVGLMARYGLAMVAHHAREHTLAIEALEAVVAERPGFHLGWYNLGTIRQHVGDYTGAGDALRMAAALYPEFGATRTNLGNALLGQGRHEEALAVFEEALKHPTGDIEARWNRSHALVALGRWLEGWAEYEARWGLPGFVQQNRYHHPSPVYAGEPLDGKRLIVMEEQGYGDLIQTLRYDRDLWDMGAHVTWAVRPEMVRLCQAAGVNAVDINAPNKEHPADYNVACMSLIRWTRTTPKRVPRPDGYLHATRHRFHLPGLTVGICWQGSPLHRNSQMRNIPAAALSPLMDLPGINWVVMGKDGWKPEMAQLGHTNGLDGVTDWQDTANRIAGLDLLITVDTAVAHLAGALNVPVWIALAAVPDMRWGLGSTLTPWYRSARLFRQDRGNEWAPVIERMAHQLINLTQRKAAV